MRKKLIHSYPHHEKWVAYGFGFRHDFGDGRYVEVDDVECSDDGEVTRVRVYSNLSRSVAVNGTITIRALILHSPVEVFELIRNCKEREL